MSDKSSVSTLYQPATITGGILTSTIPETRTRIRVNHSRTQRDGWQYETTVEVEFGGDEVGTDSNALERLAGLTQLAREIGEEECRARNAREGRGMAA